MDIHNTIPINQKKIPYTIPPETKNIIKHFGPLIIFFILAPGFIFEFGLEEQNEKKRKISIKTAFIHACIFAIVLKLIQIFMNKFS